MDPMLWIFGAYAVIGIGMFVRLLSKSEGCGVRIAISVLAAVTWPLLAGCILADALISHDT